MAGKLIIFSAPSGSGKSTIINYLLKPNYYGFVRTQKDQGRGY